MTCFACDASGKGPACQETQEMQGKSLGQEDPPEEGTATHSSILAWRIPWTQEPYGLQSMGSPRVGQDGSDLAQHRAQLMTYKTCIHSTAKYKREQLNET